jgi:hypothetical protein
MELKSLIFDWNLSSLDRTLRLIINTDLNIDLLCPEIGILLISIA